MKIIIANNGEIDSKALTLLGASSKRGDSSKIGMFGSGNKYALAYLIRNGFQVDIYSGTRKVLVETKREEFREQTFDVIYIDGEKTSITTQTGPQWSFWQAIREIYSNAIDEGGDDIYFGNEAEIMPRQGRTTFVISSTGPEGYKEIVNFQASKEKYFSKWRGAPIYDDGKGNKIYAGNDGTIFRKGIRCVNEQRKPSLFVYDLNEVEIGEDRIITYSYKSSHQIGKLLMECTDEAIVDILFTSMHTELLNDRVIYESHMEVNGDWSVKDGILGDQARKFLEGKTVARIQDKEFVRNPRGNYFVGNSWYREILSQLGPHMSGIGAESDGHGAFKKVENQMITDKAANGFKRLSKMGVSFDGNWEIAKFQESNVIISWLKDTMLISETIAGYTDEQVERTLLKGICEFSGKGEYLLDKAIDLFYKTLIKK